MSDTASDWSAYWRGRGAAGEAFLGEGVERHPRIAGFWDEAFAEAGQGARVLDLACGAGSVLRRAEAAGLTRLTAADVSEDALAVARAALPGLAAVACSADAVPLADGAFDVVTSQFGFEYAGPGAPAEMARLTAPGGRLVALVHVAGGAIHAEVAGRAAEADAVRATGFVKAAQRLITAEFGRDADEVQHARAAFAGPERALAERLPRGGVGAHLYQGFRRLYERRAAYDLADVTGWLDGMEAELSAFAGRMATMQAAARSRDEMDDVVRTLEQGGVTASFEPFALGDDERPSAWAIKGLKRQ